MPFLPKQAYAPNVDLDHQIVGDSITRIAEEFLKLIKLLLPNVVVHDNGCSSGQNRSHSRMARARVSKMPAESLELADATFTRSFSDLLLLATRNIGNDAREIYRTLKPGGTAVATWFNRILHQEIIKNIHTELRGDGVSLPHGMPSAWYDGKFFTCVPENGGVDSGNTAKYIVDTQCGIPDLRRWTAMLWSYVGCPAGGWTLADEEKWGDAVAKILQNLKTSLLYKRSRAGGMLMKFNVCIATK
ncbi:S-adenosyl-L-methionine-dependent methyltransferase [Xylaria palmicola]|nr:S-adenosyl-L-methionine-dependent methyltransferase [Xylaria palmicola]